MRVIIIFILCLLLSIICFPLAIPVSPETPQPKTEDPAVRHRRLALISGDVFDFMKANPFDSFRIRTLNKNGKSVATIIPSWNYIEHSMKLDGTQRYYFIFRKVFKALDHDDLKTITIYFPPHPDNLKVYFSVPDAGLR